MANRVQTLRSSTPGQRPSGQLPGALYVNWPDKQLGVVDASNVAQDLVGVRFFSTSANYAIGDFVIQSGQLYRAKNAITAGAFNAFNWDLVQKASDVAAYLPLAGGTLTGPLVLAANPTAPLQAATKQYVDSGAFLPVSGGTLTGDLVLPATSPATSASAVPKTYVDANYSGFVNKLRNGTFDVWQRGNISGAAAGSSVYSADGWIAFLSGQAFSVQQIASTAIATPSWGPIKQRNLFQFYPSAAGGTGAVVSQRIESNISATLKGQVCTIQAKVFNNGPTTTPTLLVSVAGSADNWSSPVVIVNAVPLQSCPNGAWTQLAYTFNAGANADLGLNVAFQFGNMLNTAAGYVALGEADLRATPGLPTGLCANPPPPELRPIGVELPFCQRYYCANIPVHAVATAAGAGNYLGVGGNFPVQMCAVPTVVFQSQIQAPTNVGAATIDAITNMGFRTYVQSGAAGTMAFDNNYIARAEL